MKDDERTRSGIPSFGAIAKKTWITSLKAQVKQLYQEKKHPPAKLTLTAKKDPDALQKLVEAPSPLVSLIKQLRSTVDDIIHPKEKFNVTAEAVEVSQIWSEHKMTTPGLISLGSHLFVVLLIIFPVFGFDAHLPLVTETFIPLIEPTSILTLPEMEDQSGGGGGGGLEEETPPSVGELPKADDKQLVPPAQPVLNEDPILVAPPTVVAPQLAYQLTNMDLALLGAVEGVPGPPSAGPGVGGGIGTGRGRGVGEGRGAGVGEGEGGGFGGGVFRIGGGVTPPTILFKVDPKYSEEARKARYQGTVVLEAIVRKDGTVDILRVVRSLGFGLDENAVQALKKWKFRPGMRNGLPVDVALNIEVNFNLR